MIPVDDARRRILEPLRPTAPETVALAQAWTRVLAEPVRARHDQPQHDVSAMDGYALRADDEGSREVIGAAPAGHPFAGQVAPGQAVRLFTGSVVPPGADTVVAQEDTERQGDTLQIGIALRRGRHIRPRAGDFAVGDVLLEPGTRLGARAIGLAASANHPWLTVHRRPRIAILATGDEIALPGDPLGEGGVVSSNAHALAGLIAAAGGEPTILPIARDSLDAIAATADRLGGVDLLVTTGGASVGEHDLVQKGLGERGFVLDFWQIAMRPGKPLIYGSLGDVPVLGLPGNPVSAFVCGVLFMVPAVARLSGAVESPLATATATLACAVAANDHRADHLRATLTQGDGGDLVAEPFAEQDSSHLRRLAAAHALIFRPPHAPAAAPGERVQILRLDVALH